MGTSGICSRGGQTRGICSSGGQIRALGPDFQKILGQTYEKLRIRSDLGKS